MRWHYHGREYFETEVEKISMHHVYFPKRWKSELSNIVSQVIFIAMYTSILGGHNYRDAHVVF